MTKVTDRVEPGPSQEARRATGEGPGLGRGGRTSRRRKVAAVMRLLWGEDLEAVSRELGVTAARLSGWREDFLAAVGADRVESCRLMAHVCLPQRCREGSCHL